MSPGRAQIYLELAQARKVQGDINGMWEALDIAAKEVPEPAPPVCIGDTLPFFRVLVTLTAGAETSTQVP